MLKQYALAAFLWALSLPFVARAHHIEPYDMPLKTWRLQNGQSLSASFLTLRNDSVLLENRQGLVSAVSCSALSEEDRRFAREKAAQIARMNAAARPDARPVKKPLSGLFVGLLFAWLAWAAFQRTRSRQIAALALGCLLFSPAFKTMGLGTDPLFIDKAFQPFKPQVATHWDADWFYVESKGIPTTHSMMKGITKWQQQVPLPQCYIGDNAWQIPLQPVLAAAPVPVNQQHFLRGAVAIAANGVPIFNPYTNTGLDALVDGQLDQWGGHSGRADDYHYHIAPLHLDAQTPEVLPIAFALDGFAVYGALEPDGTPMAPLDANHGHYGADGLYHYHGTEAPPYMIGNMVGKVTEDATLQIVPQPRATPVRPSLTPLNGAAITDFQPRPAGDGYILTYVRNGQTTQVDYSWTSAGAYTYLFTSPAGAITEKYNGFRPCNVPTPAIEELSRPANVSVFPNPTKGAFFLQIEHDASPENVSVSDWSGRVLWAAPNPAGRIQFPVFEKGLYRVNVRFTNGTVCKKIIVQ